MSVRDNRGETVLSWSKDITLALEGGTQGTELLGTTTRTPLAGIAIFDDLVITATGEGVRLKASSGRLEAVSGPFAVFDRFHASHLAAGEAHTCALTANGLAYCWGYNGAGQLGSGDLDDRVLPTTVETEARFTSLSANRTHTCGLSTEGQVYCWGSNGAGQLGDGTQENGNLPVPVSLPGPAVDVDAGSWHTCALLADHTAYCWGSNSGGSLGIGVGGGFRTYPVRVQGNLEWASIDAGYQHTCGLTTEGKAYCWGPNVYAENGDGTRDVESWTPNPVLGDHTFSTLVAGGASCHGQTCGLTVEGEVLCWGKNYQQYFPSSERFITTPTPLTDDPGFVEILPGPYMICGLTENQELHCLGDFFLGAQLRDLRASTLPVPFAPGLRVTEVAIGGTHTCVLTTENVAYCWGFNDYGQLGSGTGVTGRFAPTPVWRPQNE